MDILGFVSRRNRKTEKRARSFNAEEHERLADETFALFNQVLDSRPPEAVHRRGNRLATVVEIGQFALAQETACGLAYVNTPMEAIIARTELADDNTWIQINIRNQLTSEDIGKEIMTTFDQRPIYGNVKKVQEFRTLLDDVIAKAGLEYQLAFPPS